MSVTLVTGAASGIGAATATLLAERGHTLALFDRDEAALTDVAKPLLDEGRSVYTYTVDVTSSAEVDAAVERVENGFGPISGLANVAGVLRMGRVADLSDEDWNETFAVNATGVFHVCRAVSRRMAARKAGSIVTVASNAAGVPRSHMAAYAASKAAATSLTHSLGLDLAPLGVRCNVVAPGSTDTPMLRSMWTDETGSKSTLDGDPGQFRLGIPLGRIGSPEDVARSVAFLLSDEARHVTLATLLVDGGAALGAV
ncbi:2,3-dihydro-2,3-dihydroxybenzoate dehydrogenase [Amycolatopsis kentuckyensis]|uniref:2,3-dihydro-2,3-dihydroxybenzoate dehydrogenase n=1 Tax=Amycolatopsis kentuckyensis TaxID=218823 RepID=UPI003568F2C9